MEVNKIVKDTQGTAIDIDSLPLTYTYNADGTLNYAQVTDGVKTWRQTYTYTSGKVTAISGWVLQ